jgi:hypothetical protein
MEHTIRVRTFGAAVILGMAVLTSLITSTVIASRAYRSRGEQNARTQQDLTVKGSARIAVRSDISVWNISVSGDGPQLVDAYNVLEFGVDRVNCFLHAQAFSDAEISLSAIETRTHTARTKDGEVTDRVVGYTLERTFIVTTAAVDRTVKAAGEVTQLLRENVRVCSHAPAYSYTQLASLKVQILGDASRDARNRALEIASKSGCAIGQVRRAQMGVIQITQPNSTEVSDYGLYDTSTVDKDVSAVVTITFGIES